MTLTATSRELIPAQGSWQIPRPCLVCGKQTREKVVIEKGFFDDKLAYAHHACLPAERVKLRWQTGKWCWEAQFICSPRKGERMTLLMTSQRRVSYFFSPASKHETPRAQGKFLCIELIQHIPKTTFYCPTEYYNADALPSVLYRKLLTALRNRDAERIVRLSARLLGFAERES